MRFPIAQTAACIATMVVCARAGDWPQILGPGRNGVAVDEQIADAWPATQLATVWRRNVGSGFAGISVSRSVAILFHRIGEEEIAEGMQADSGKTLWKSSLPTKYVPSYTEDDGPRAVPVISGNRVYVHGAMGGLRCLDLNSGKLLWQRNTYEEFNSKKPFRGEPAEGYFGMASSPIVEGDKVILNVGGDASDAGIVAFAADSGRTLWRATRERAGYSSPVAVTVQGTRHVVFVTRLNVLSLNPDTGEVRFQFPFGRTGPTVNAANPVVLGGHLLVTASYGIGSALAKITADGAEVVWRDRDILASQYTTCVEKDGYLFGIHGRQDGPPAELRCIDLKAQKVLWSRPDFGYATLIRCGDKLVVLKTDGTLVLADANSRKYEERASFRVSEDTVRALPALANGLLYVRDTHQLQCIDLRPRRP